MTIIIASSIDLEQARRFVDLAWAEYKQIMEQPFIEPTIELRRAMLWLAWQACRVEREAQEEIRKVAIEEERAATVAWLKELEEECATMGARYAEENGQSVIARQYAADAATARWLADKVRARSDVKP